MKKTRLHKVSLAAFGVALAALVVAANIRAGGAPESDDSPSGDLPAAPAVLHKEVVWPWQTGFFVEPSHP